MEDDTYDFPSAQESPEIEYATEEDTPYEPYGPFDFGMTLDDSWIDWKFFDPKVNFAAFRTNMMPVYYWRADNSDYYIREYFEKIKAQLEDSVDCEGTFYYETSGPMITYRISCDDDQEDDVVHILMDECKELMFFHNEKYYCSIDQDISPKKVMMELTRDEDSPAPYLAVMRFEGETLKEVAKFCHHMDSKLEPAVEKRNLGRPEGQHFLLQQHWTSFHSTYLLSQRDGGFVRPKVKVHLCLYSREVHFITSDGNISLPLNKETLNQVTDVILKFFV